MDNKIFSICILTYKNFEGIYNTLDSLFEQDYDQIELMIADDGSPNYYDEMIPIKKYIEENKTDNIVSVQYIHLDVNQGTVKNCNHALTKMKGEYIKLFGGGDVFSSSTAISRYVEFLDQSEYNIVFAKLVGKTLDGRYFKNLASCEDDYLKLSSMSCEQLMNRLFVRNCLPAPAWCAKRELFKKNGSFLPVTKLIEDYPYWIHLCLNHEKIGFLDEVLIEYRLDGVSSKGQYSVTFMEDLFAIYRNYIFPYDKRFGIFQPIYNWLKVWGLKAYYDKAKWNSFSINHKLVSYMKYGIMYLYIWYLDKLQVIKNSR